MGYEGWSDVTDYCILRRVLELRDSPLAGECAAIIKAHRPDARCADIPLGSSSGIRPLLLLAPGCHGNRSTPTPAVGFQPAGTSYGMRMSAGGPGTLLACFILHAQAQEDTAYAGRGRPPMFTMFPDGRAVCFAAAL